jgi:hypothetical protein
VYVVVCYSTTSQGVILFVFCAQFVFWFLFGCGVRAFSFTTILFLPVVVVGNVEVF